MEIRRTLRGFAALVALAALARVAAAPLASFGGEAREETIVAGAEGRRIAATVYVPAAAGEASGARPPRAVVLCHGVSASRRHMGLLARELARRGFLAVAFDYGGEGDSEARPQREDANVADVRAAIALARRHGAAGPVALIGHSMGVTSAVGAALEDPEVACVVALGQRPFALPDRPRALLAAAGAMDAFHPLRALLGAVSESAGRPVAAFETVVDPATGAVRRVFLSGACEHAGEVWDGAIAGEAVAFIEAALAERPAGDPAPGAAGGAAAAPGAAAPGAPEAPALAAPPPYLWRPPAGASLLFISRAAAAGALALLGLAAAALLGADAPGRAGAALRRRVLSALLLAGAIGPALLARAGAVPLGLARDFAPALVAGAMIANALVARRAAGGGGAGPAGPLAAGFAIGAGWVGGTALGAAPTFFLHPDLLWGLPAYLWQGIAFRIQFSLDALAPRLVPPPGAEGVLGSWTLAAIVALELGAPGRALGFAGALAMRAFRALGGVALAPPPAGADAGAAGAGPAVSRARLGCALGALVLIAAALLFKRSGEGLLSGEGALSTVALAGLRLFIFPVAVMTATVQGMRLFARLRAGPR